MKAKHLKLCWLLVILVVSITMGFTSWVHSAAAAEADTVTIFAAASTTDVLTEIGRLFAEQKLGRAVYSFAASSTLARQVESGAPADVFLSADLEWMDYLEKKKLIEPATRQDLLGNRIVLIAPVGSPTTAVALGPGCDLTPALAGGRLVMGDPGHVPVGRYAKAALESLGAWQGVEKQVAGVATVRAALALVERGEAPLGIVYATDAAVSAKVKIVGRFPEGSHPPIVYPVAVVAGRNTPAVARFIVFLRSNPAKAVFEGAGFTVR
ncbi:MAG: molybdate ABC transporter substrate-binding protein [Desulfatitalea sp.]